ncbi:hypothetical protein BDW74DRAFT_120899 [Aspergillus multicolor]|uniref:uncharacterized protein n=1 Tax=Aspergillus multicolor TaxID=41759 RepID=UPI003CCCEB62
MEYENLVIALRSDRAKTEEDQRFSSPLAQGIWVLRFNNAVFLYPAFCFSLGCFSVIADLAWICIEHNAFIDNGVDEYLDKGLRAANSSREREGQGHGQGSLGFHSSRIHRHPALLVLE